jgi:hypothetical protein
MKKSFLLKISRLFLRKILCILHSNDAAIDLISWPLAYPTDYIFAKIDEHFFFENQSSVLFLRYNDLTGLDLFIIAVNRIHTFFIYSLLCAAMAYSKNKMSCHCVEREFQTNTRTPGAQKNLLKIFSYNTSIRKQSRKNPLLRIFHIM